MVSGISEGDSDLFGLPLLPEKGRGRPAHVWTSENSNKVNLLFACGHTPMAVAQALGISKPTFYKHYFNEISRSKFAPLMMTARQLERLNAEADKGNVAAEKALAALIQAERVKAHSDRMTATQAKAGGTKAETPAPLAKLGKKEEAKLAAHGVTGKFAPPPQPGLLN